METKDWPELSADLCRRVGRELAREHGRPTAAVVYTGVCAEYLRRWEIGATGATTPGGAHLEALHGDLLALKASEELGTFLCGSLVEWVAANWVFVRARVDTLLQMPAIPGGVSVVDAEAERRHCVAAMKSITAASDSTTAALAWAGAAAVARVRLGDRWYGLSADERDAHLAETVCGDPVWAAAGEELDDQHRRGVERWVHERWDDICSAAEELAALTAAVDTPATVEQRIAIARHEVTHGMLRGVRDTDDERLRQGYPAVRAYTEAVAEGLVRWEDSGGSPDGADQAMQAHADADPAVVASDLNRMLTPDARDKLREAIRDRWAQLAPPIPWN